MKAHILYIGILDENGCQHSVEFKAGVNVITGRSSTGKSALIEIFDYCFGSSDYTVPAGIITKNARLYFSVVYLRASVLVLAREPASNRAFLREEYDLDHFSSIDWINADYFAKQDFYSLQEFLKNLKRFFGITVTDVDEDLDAYEWKRRKSATPSTRSFTSFMLQHQNLIANKHAIFYRFDQKEKREQTIEHLKIFLGFVDQNYFILKQRLNELEAKRRQLVRELPRQADTMLAYRKRLEGACFELEAISGRPLNLNLDGAVRYPNEALSKLSQQKITFSADSDEHVRKQLEEQKNKSRIVGRLRELQRALSEIDSSIAFSKRYAADQQNTLVPRHVHLAKEECPFCHSLSISMEEEANKLSEAIDWLNGELRRSSYRKASYDEERMSLLKEIEAVKGELTASEARLGQLRGHIKDLKQTTTQYELTVRARMRLEAVLEDCAQFKYRNSEQDLEVIDNELQRIKTELTAHYDVDRKLAGAEDRIEELMQMYSQRFDFERSYRPINLRFSLSDFDLWHQDNSGNKVYLRAMGSGANWLSCHLVLFLSLQRYFCELGDRCLIPPILFIDQPSQVYFPAILDGDNEFMPKELAERDKSRGNRGVDEDLRAVTNLFEQLVRYCEETELDTGIRPQVIVTDHADHLKLNSPVTFESIVRRRWREEYDGFIDLRGLRQD